MGASTHAIVISSCLLGASCRYDGGSKPVLELACARLADRLSSCGWTVAPVCPEMDGGLACPRPPAERWGDRVITIEGVDVTAAYRTGALRTLDTARAIGAHLAILKSRSPSCGIGSVYDGTFSGALTRRDGVTAELLKREGFTVVDEKLVRFCEPSFEHPVAIVLGSGLGALADKVRPVRRIPYEDIEGFPAEAIPVEGHRFEVIVGSLEGVPVVVYPGRVHLYQGYSALEVTSLVRHAHRLGCRDIVLTCASGAVGDIEPGTVGLITDQLNLTGVNPLASAECVAAAEIDSPFIAMADAYSSYLAEFARAAAADAGVKLVEGVYAGLLGPTYETAAEVRALKILGADYVGMSTVCEAITAHALGMEMLGLTIVTNKAGLSGNAHGEVLAMADDTGEAACSVIMGVLRNLGGK